MPSALHRSIMYNKVEYTQVKSLGFISIMGHIRMSADTADTGGSLADIVLLSCMKADQLGLWMSVPAKNQPV